MLLINIKADSYFQWAIYAIGITIYAIMVVIINALLFDKEQLKSVLIRIKSMFLHKKVKEK